MASRFTPATTPQDEATMKAREVAKMLSRTLTGGGPAPVVNQNTMLIPSDKVGMVIGKGGTTIKEIETTIGVKLQLESSGDPRKMFITGSEDRVAMAKIKIQEIIDVPTFVRRSTLNPTKTIQILCDQVGLVIGRGGANIKKISEDTHCHLKVEREDQAEINGHPRPAKGYQNLHIMGTPEAAANAEKAVMALLQKDNMQKLQRGGGRGYGAHQQQVQQVRAMPYGTQTVPLVQGYGSLAQPYTTAPIMQQVYGTTANGYPGVNYAYPQQQHMYPTQPYTMQAAPGMQQYPEMTQTFAPAYMSMHGQQVPVGQPINYQQLMAGESGNNNSGVQQPGSQHAADSCNLSIDQNPPPSNFSTGVNNMACEQSSTKGGEGSSQQLKVGEDKTAAHHWNNKPITLPSEAAQQNVYQRVNASNPTPVQFQINSNGNPRFQHVPTSENQAVPQIQKGGFLHEPIINQPRNNHCASAENPPICEPANVALNQSTLI